MRVLIVSWHFPPSDGGIETHVFEVAKHLHRIGDEVMVITAGDGEAERIDATLPFRIQRVPRVEVVGVRQLLLFVFSVMVLGKHRGFDCLYSSHWRLSGIPVWTISVLTRIPYYQAIHGSEVMERALHRLRRVLFRPVARGAVRLVALGSYQEVLLRRLGVCRAKIRVLPEGVDLERFNAQEPACLPEIVRRHDLEDRKVILTVGRLVSRKGHDVVIRALPEVLEQVPDAIYLVVGSGPEEQRLRELASAVGVQGQVMFAGRVSEDDLRAYYYACDVFAMPNREEEQDVEGFGIVFVEAGACGKPVIGGRSGGTGDAIEDGVSGFLVEPTGVSEVARRLVRLLSNRDLATRMGRAGRRRVESMLNYGAIVGELRSGILNDLAARHRTTLNTLQ